MYFHPSFLRVEMIERLFTQTYRVRSQTDNKKFTKIKDHFFPTQIAVLNRRMGLDFFMEIYGAQ